MSVVLVGDELGVSSEVMDFAAGLANVFGREN